MAQGLISPSAIGAFHGGLDFSHPSGWYHEYTVVTPGSSDRGARRIISGDDGSRFYTDDHYASFREVISGVTS